MLKPILAMNHLFGGLLGIVTPILMIPAALSHPLSLLFLSLLGSLQALGIVTAILIFGSSIVGFKISLVLNALQMFQISARIVDFAFVQGAYIALVASNVGTSMNFGFAGTGNLYFDQGLPWGIGVNFVAVFWFFWLRYKLRELNRAAISESISEAKVLEEEQL